MSAAATMRRDLEGDTRSLRREERDRKWARARNGTPGTRASGTAVKRLPEAQACMRWLLVWPRMALIRSTSLRGLNGLVM